MGAETITELDGYKAEKLEEIFGDEPIPEEWRVIWGAHVSYAGEGPEPRFMRPGHRGAVAYEQDNGRPEGDRMVPSIEWRNVADAPNPPA